METTTQPIDFPIERGFVGYETARDFVSINCARSDVDLIITGTWLVMPG